MNTSNHRRLPIWTLAVISCTLAAGNASAGPFVEQVSVKVKYADLNISTQEGATRLYGRIKRAARTVCNLDNIQPEERLYGNWKPCYDQAIATAVAKVNSPMLSAVHAGKTNQPRLAALQNSPSSAQ